MTQVKKKVGNGSIIVTIYSLVTGQIKNHFKKKQQKLRAEPKQHNLHETVASPINWTESKEI